LSLKDFYIQKLNSFECGFLSLGKIQNSFSIHFFIIILMFVIFDLEIIMFFGLFISNLLLLFGLVFIFLFILGGLYLE
jgi:NADH:ubiquinone oxidoreductase subunit 3 (subunit A)